MESGEAGIQSAAELPAKADDDAASDASGQKRQRDYGEELKGLTDDDSDRDAALPSPKRARLESSDPAGPVSEDLDDGEIVESDPAPEDEAKAEPGDAEEVEETKSQLPAGWNQGVNLGVRTSFGNPGSKIKSFARPSQQLASQETLPVANVEDDSDEADPPAISRTAASSATDHSNAAAQKVPGKQTQSSKQPWITPDPPQDLACEQSASYWLEKLETWWVPTFLHANLELLPRVTAKRILKEFNREHYSIIKNLPGQKKDRAAAARAALEASSKIDQEWVESMITNARDGVKELGKPSNDRKGPQQPEPTRAAETLQINSGSHFPVLSEEEELRQQERYFPGENPARFCLYCASEGHHAASCPELTCRFCKRSDHGSLACPTIQRCLKCRQPGHSRETCKERLSLAKSEQGACMLCGNEGHVEERCSSLWRSFKPSTTVKKVKYIPTFCYTCGAEGHYGPECGAPGRATALAGPTSWLQANRDLYVDPESVDLPLAWKDVDPARRLGQNGAQSEFHIRGKATRQTHIQFVSSDESEEEFLREPVRHQATQRDIRISTNIGGSNPGGNRQRSRQYEQSQRRRHEPEFDPPPPPPAMNLPPHLRGVSNPGWQPPLPPGPPPPLQRAPPGTLPQRPNAANSRDGPRQSQQNGRGGHRPNRGKGRRGGRQR